MAEWRQDTLTGDWVIVAPARGQRPGTSQAQQKSGPAPPAHDAACPFCPGNEGLLSDIVRETPGPTPAGWATRIVTNKFPAVVPPPARSGPGALPAIGHHHVIVETPRHDADLTGLSKTEMAAVVDAYRERYETLSRIPGMRAVILFRNRGAAAGASLSHPHSQVVALHKMPPRMRRIRDRARRHQRRIGSCLLCALLADGKPETPQHITESPGFRVFVPQAAMGPYEIMIAPKRHMPAFADITDSEADDLADVLQSVLQAVARLLDDPPYNYVIESFGRPGGDDPARHWYLRLLPGLTTGGGFEMGAGAAINPSRPEDDAAVLRDAFTRSARGR